MADLQYTNMQKIGPISFSDEEMKFAQQINDQFPASRADKMLEEMDIPEDLKPLAESLKGKPLWGENLPSMDEGKVYTGSTDVGDVSQITPLSMLHTACVPVGAPGHNWAFTASVGSSIGHKGMLHAAKIMAATAFDLYTEPEHLKKARAEFNAARNGKPYQNPIPDYVQPPHYPNPERD
jgi:aminobenzoyl-glutamate utilization protein B